MRCPSIIFHLAILLLLSPLSTSHAQQPPEEKLLLNRCSKCHTLDRLCQKLGNYDQKQFQELVNRMVSHGADLNVQEQQVVSSYLTELPAGAGPICVTAFGEGAIDSETLPQQMKAPSLVFLHPVLMILTNILALYVLYLGWVRFRSKHLRHNVVFPWKRHTNLGYLVMLLWLTGMLGGMLVAMAFFGNVGISGWHFFNALLMLPFILFGVITGRLMNQHKNKYKRLPLIHAANNVLLILMAACQTSTGIKMMFQLLN